MLVPLFVSLAIASAAIFLSFNTREEMVKVASVFIAGLCLLFSLFFAPAFVKLLIIVIPFLSKKLPAIQ